MQSSDNIQSLGKILDFIRFTSILLLLIHFYCTCYPVLHQLHLTATIADRIIYNLTSDLKALQYPNIKLSILLLLTVALIGAKGRKNEKLTIKPILYFILIGVILYFGSNYILYTSLSQNTQSALYISFTSLGYLGILAGGNQVSRLIHLNINKDPFNNLNETFRQEERLLENEFSVNLPTEYNLKGKVRKGWINVLSPQRATIVSGSPGSGKTYFVLRHFITQHLAKQFTMFVYDYKFPDLTKIAYNHLLKHSDKYRIPPRFYIINFDDLTRSHRCNPLAPSQMTDITDATESSRTIMLALNKEWIKRVGDFWVESPINFTTAIFWFLRRFQGGKYCTLPHAIELASVPYKDLFPVMAMEDQISILMNPFYSAWEQGAQEQLEGQIASAKICLARLSSPQLYYVLSGNEFTLDINNPEAPKVVAVGNNPQRQGIYGAVLSLYAERLLKQINQPGKLKSSVIIDEAPTIFIGNIDNHIGVARGRLCSTTLGIQDISQFRRDYGREQADVIINTCANIISGQVLGDSAKLMSERIGKIMQDRQSVSINSNDTSISNSTQLDSAIPPAKIANLSSGHFVGAIADTPQQPIEYKTFSARIINNHDALAKEEAAYQELPIIRNITQSEVMDNYYQIKQDIKDLIETELNKIRNDPSFSNAAINNATNNTSAVST